MFLKISKQIVLCWCRKILNVAKKKQIIYVIYFTKTSTKSLAILKKKYSDKFKKKLLDSKIYIDWQREKKPIHIERLRWFDTFKNKRQEWNYENNNKLFINWVQYFISYIKSSYFYYIFNVATKLYEEFQ